jgi:DNA transposition AAA+ family ATPase
LLLAHASYAAFAQDSGSSATAELRELCTERPGLTAAACNVDAGHFQIEVELADWERDKNSKERQDRVTLRDMQL